jgi:hypothetical protein
MLIMFGLGEGSGSFKVGWGKAGEAEEGGAVVSFLHLLDSMRRQADMPRCSLRPRLTSM